ncbi:nitroreductase family deazaflavin-dependent oxidoreductase [Gordonia soli]|uniref:Nitroreductase n=1 Tax=Gordonia soli NBRC 108243 TaxID=1223545 RepID=M0QLV9_9ACTN|nr:nitroreductase family deazaflavin-dependent oxidoreductase [Gordonia soli]GAC69660.1 hypothetical protein GS4_26_01080 [Gordonia soli NBRC 108243]
MGVLTPLAVKVGSISWMPKLLPQIVKVDAAIQGVSGRRVSLLDIAGLPNIVMLVPGRKSGVPRLTRLLAVPSGENWLIAGSYFGGPTMPQWVFNVRAADEIEVRHSTSSGRFTPRELHDAERDAAWQELRSVWPNFDLYEKRTERLIPVFLLEPID